MRFWKKKEEEPIVVQVEIERPKPQTGTCKTCLYWGDVLDNGGACHLSPPPFPQTRADNWCGQWEEL